MTRYEAHISKGWNEVGLVDVIVARIRDNGSTDVAAFLVDRWCLGVKDALSNLGGRESDVKRLVGRLLPEDQGERIHPACARKLVEGAIAYASTFGFAPHRDYRKARHVLSGIDASMCPEEFTFGQNGRPCFFQTADDSSERVARVLAALKAHCGDGGYDYVVSVDPEEEEENDYEDSDFDGEDSLDFARDRLMEWVANEPGVDVTFYELSGMVTALLLSPGIVTPAKLINLIGKRDEDAWKDVAALQTFLPLVTDYWNHVNQLILYTIDPDAPKEIHPIDCVDSNFVGDAGDFVDVLCEWVTGFDQVTKRWPDKWREALDRPDLAPHWEIVRLWANFGDPGCREEIVARTQAGDANSIFTAVRAITRALRTPPNPR